MELKTVNASLQKGLKKIETAVSPEVIQKLESFKSLTIAGINDKAGYEMVNRARITAKNQRIALDKMRKEMGEEALRYKQAVDSTAKRIQDTIIAPAEEHLKAEIERINAEKARIELAAKIEKEIAACWEEAHTANEQFDDQKAETERLEKQRIEQAEKEAELAAKQAEIERKEREARIAAESRAAAEREAKAKIERAELEAEKARRKAEEAKQLAKENAEREAREAAEAEAQRLALAPDIDKALNYFQKLAAIDLPVVKDSSVKVDVDAVFETISTFLKGYSKKKAS